MVSVAVPAQPRYRQHLLLSLLVKGASVQKILCSRYTMDVVSHPIRSSHTLNISIIYIYMYCHVSRAWLSHKCQKALLNVHFKQRRLLFFNNIPPSSLISRNALSILRGRHKKVYLSRITIYFLPLY